MNKKNTMAAGIIAAVLLIGGGAFALKNNKSNTSNNSETTAQKAQEAANGMQHDEVMAKEKAASTETIAATDTPTKDTTTASPAAALTADPVKKEVAAATHGTYVTLADFNADRSKYADSKKVYFFHASWCPICKSINAEIEADITKVPAGLTIIKTDFDTATALRQKYGVTTQYTFVQFDANGDKLAKWSATSLAAAVAGVKS